MHLAERWLGFGLIVAGAIALAPPLLVSSSRTHASHRSHVSMTMPRCSEARHAQPPAPPEAQDPYQRVFEQARPQLVRCFRGAESRVELLITIEPDGHVARVSHRPNPSSPTTTCLTRVVERQRFPSSPTTIAIRVPLTRR